MWRSIGRLHTVYAPTTDDEVREAAPKPYGFSPSSCRAASA
jgi:hypothetical protein